LKKIRDLDNRKARNILKLKIDEIVVDAVKRIILLRALNFPSSRSFFFINLVIGEGFTDPFFRLLDSFDKNIKVL
jgi:hypothetical protein